MNDAPIIVGAIISPEVDEDVQIEIDQDMLDISDVDGENSFTVYAADGENYSVIGENIVVPDPDYNGTVFVPISIQDSSGASSNTIEFSVVFVPVNDAPTITNLELNPSIPELGDDIVLDYVFFDVDGDDESGTSITWYNDGLVQNQFQNQTTIPSSATLCEEVWYAMVVPSDGVLAGEGINTPEAVICGNNTPPVWSSEDIVFSIDEDAADQTFSLADYVSDSEQSTSQLLFSVDDNSDVINLGASFSGSDLVLSALVENYFTEEPIALALIVDDQLGYSDTVSVAVNIDPVNDDPVLSAYNGSLELQEDDSLVISLESLSVQDVDNVFPHDFLLTVSEGDHYTVINSPDDTTSIIYPVQDYNGIINTSVSVSDGELSSNPFDLAITVTPVNDAPVVLAQLSISTEEDVSFMITLDDIIYEDVDNGAEDLSIILSSGENYSVESATVTPSMDYIGLLNIPLHLYDGQDTSLTSFVLEAEVLGVNDAPILVTALEDITVAEDSEGASFSLISNNDNLYFDDIDIVSGDLLSYTVAEAVGGLLLVSSENDSVHIDFMQDSSGTDTLFITASDLSGLSVTDTVVVLVTPVNDAPVVLAQLSISTEEDVSFMITLDDIIYEDVDNGAEDLSIILSSGENYSVESATVTPSMDYIGLLNIPLHLYDGQDTSLTSFVLEAEVLGVNDAPILVTALEDITVAEDSEGASFSLISNNDNLYFDDIDIVSGDLLSYTVAEAVGGLLLVSSENDSVHIDFMQDSSGTDTLFITASDLSGLSVTDTVVVLVTPVNDAPVIAGVLTEFSMLEDDSITIGLSDIQILDVDSDSFTMSILEGENYTVSGSVIIPTANFNGALSAPITVNDGEDESEPFSLTILVEPVNDAPLGFSLLSPENGATITILASDIINQTSLEVTWLQSIDPDNESVVYGLQMDAADWSSVIISGFPDTSYNVSYAIITAILDSLDASELSIDWTVFSTDGIDTVYAEQVFTFNVDAYDVLSVDEVLIPDVYALHQNYPNPFNPTTTVKYDLPEQAVVTIKIFDVLGREVISLIDNMYQNPGFKSIRWNGLNQDGKQVVSGMYFYVIKTENFSQTRKMLMIK